MYEEVKYPQYKNLKLDWPAERVLRVTMSNGPVNAMDYEMHRDIAEIWRLIDADSNVNAVVVTGEGKHFSAGGAFEMEQRIIADPAFRSKLWRDGRALVQNMINCNKPVVSAINGSAVGGGLAVALMADVSVAARGAKLIDGHTRFGIAAGDHAVLIWPLLCGMAKAKYYMLTCDSISGEEAERIGLVSMCVDDDQVQARALQVAQKLAKGPAAAIRHTKVALNQWLHQAWPAYETSLAFEMMDFGGADVKEGLAAMMEKRDPRYDPVSPV